MASPTTIAKEVASRRSGLLAYLRRVEVARVQGLAWQHDVTRSYTGSFIEFYMFYERALERLFLGTLMQRLQFQSVRIAPLVEMKSNRVARSIAFRGRSYGDWLPYKEHTSRRAKALLAKGEPFTSISVDDRHFLDNRFCVVRNVIAHESTHSRRRYENEVIGDTPIPPSQRKPGAYLAGQHSMGITRFSYISSRAVRILFDICGR